MYSKACAIHKRDHRKSTLNAALGPRRGNVQPDRREQNRRVDDDQRILDVCLNSERRYRVLERLGRVVHSRNFCCEVSLCFIAGSWGKRNKTKSISVR
jgi:hypothetical protein